MKSLFFRRLIRVLPVIGFLCAGFMVAACTDARDHFKPTELKLTPREAVMPSGAPTVMRLIIAFDDDRVRLISAKPKRDNLAPLLIDNHLSRIHRGTTILVEYSLVGDGSRLLTSGRFLVGTELLAEYLDPVQHHLIRRAGTERLKTPMIRVAVPHHPDLASVEFDQLVPTEDRPVGEWPRIPLGNIALRVGNEHDR